MKLARVRPLPETKTAIGAGEVAWGVSAGDADDIWGAYPFMVMTNAPMTDGQASTDAVEASGPPAMAVYGGMGLVELLNAYRRGVEAIPPATLEMADEQLDRMFDGSDGLGEWSVRQLLGHVMDAEVMNWMRMRKAYAEEGAVFPDWDEHAYLDSGLYGPSRESPERSGQPPAAFVAMMHTTRQVAANWLGRLEESDWDRAGLHPRRGALTIRKILELTTWHMDHHAWFLRNKLRALGVPCGAAVGGGCGPSCGCAGGSGGGGDA